MAKAKGKGAAAKKPAKVAKKAARSQKKRAASKPGKAELRVDLFVREYLLDLNGRQAAIRAGYSPDSARSTASDLLATPEVQAKVQAAFDARATSVGITAEAVLARLNAIATADPRELIELHRGACRYCWGKGNRFQRTPREMAEARAQHALHQADAKAAGHALAEFDEAGGTGYNPKQDPNPKCCECFGDGEIRIVPKDTRDLSPAARLLYAGVKQSQHGLEIKMHDQTGSLVNVGKHLGMFAQRVQLGGDEKNPVKVGVIVVPAKVAGGDDGE